MAEPEPQAREPEPLGRGPEPQPPRPQPPTPGPQPPPPVPEPQPREPEPQTPEAVRRAIESEREQLAHAVDSLRDATKLSVNVPLVAAAAFGAGFFLAGGIGATVRLIFRRGREHRS